MAIAAVLPGCPPDFDRYELTPAADGAVPRVDAGPRPDGAPPPRDGGSGTTGGPCAVPYLLVAVEGLDGARPRILRYELTADGVARRCGDLRAGGDLMQQPFTVAWLDEGHVAVSGWDQLQVIDPSADEIVWEIRREGERAIDVTR